MHAACDIMNGASSLFTAKANCCLAVPKNCHEFHIARQKEIMRQILDGMEMNDRQLKSQARSKASSFVQGCEEWRHKLKALCTICFIR
ncbi:hypothetical protein CEXT_777951 [Caerostris extrusa]|uniref:Uncharacterized protein n=1 Tax=Caerostris extrusa TaxID=172846 RepID=A0AAV4REM1_CAEEX|nr:hypothetical protein CEXT_777951 [Caerostris extrusa]